MVSALSFDSMGTSNVLNSCLGSSLTGPASGNMNFGSLFGTGYGNGYGGVVDPYYGHTAEQWARMSQEQKNEAIRKFQQTQSDAAQANALAQRQTMNASNMEELTISASIKNIQALIKNSDDCKVYLALKSLVNTVKTSETYKPRVNGKVGELTDLQAKATVIALYARYTNGGNLDAEIHEHLDSFTWGTGCNASRIIDWLHNNEVGGADEPEA